MNFTQVVKLEKLKTLSEIMDTDIPIISTQSSTIIVLKMTGKYGCVVVLENKKIKGIITDGDLRRSISKLNLNEKQQ